MKRQIMLALTFAAALAARSTAGPPAKPVPVPAPERQPRLPDIIPQGCYPNPDDVRDTAPGAVAQAVITQMIMAALFQDRTGDAGVVHPGLAPLDVFYLLNAMESYRPGADDGAHSQIPGHIWSPAAE